MKLSLDQSTDYSFRELHSFLGVTDPPAFVKQAEVATKEALAALPTESFADRYHRAFPMDSAPNVYVSNAYFINKKAELAKLWSTGFVTEVEDRLMKAAELFGIQGDIARYNASLLEKNAADYQEQFVASFDVAGTSYELFPYKTAEDLLKQAEVFNQNIKNYPFNWRQPLAESFVKRAEELGITELPDLLCKYAGMFYPDTRLFQTELERRMNKLSGDKSKEYEGCINKAANVSSVADGFAICQEAYAIEKAAGVYDNNQLYRQMGDIVDRVFTLSIYKVADLLNVIQMAGDTYAVEDLQKVSKDVYKEAFGFDLDPSDVTTLRDTLPTMPSSDAALFRELSGVKPL